MKKEEIIAWLKEDRAEDLRELWRRADRARRDWVGDVVHLRGLIEISNRCVRQCRYCGLRAGNRSLTRYRMAPGEILDCAREALRFGYGTVVLQAGEDPGLTREGVSEIVRGIKLETGLAVTLSLGERGLDELAEWRAAGADRYLLRFETSNAALYRRIHPPRRGREEPGRIRLLRELRRLGYETGSGVMVGIPGQTLQDLAADLELFRDLDLDMIGVGPYIPHSATPLARGGEASRKVSEDQAPNTELMTYKMVALSRLVCPRANIPSTTALATLNLESGREFGLQRGANVLMPNLTPEPYRVHYEIYPNKACLRESAADCRDCARGRIEAIGRSVGRGPGSALKRQAEG